MAGKTPGGGLASAAYRGGWRCCTRSRPGARGPAYSEARTTSQDQLMPLRHPTSSSAPLLTSSSNDTQPTLPTVCTGSIRERARGLARPLVRMHLSPLEADTQGGVGGMPCARRRLTSAASTGGKVGEGFSIRSSGTTTDSWERVLYLVSLYLRCSVVPEERA